MWRIFVNTLEILIIIFQNVLFFLLINNSASKLHHCHHMFYIFFQEIFRKQNYVLLKQVSGNANMFLFFLGALIFTQRCFDSCLSAD